MALGDGSAWDEANPQQSTLANTIDSYERDIRVGVRKRMAQEHVWPSTQTGTGEAGQHTYVTLQAQTSVPSMPVVASVTQAGMLFMTAGNLTFQNSASVVTTLINSAGVTNIAGASYSATGTVGEIIIGTGTGTVRTLAAATTSGQVLLSSSGAAPVWSAIGGLFGTFSARSATTIYQETADGIIFGFTNGTQASHEYTVKQDTNPSPATTVGAGSAVWVSGGQAIKIPIMYPVRKNNYHQITVSGVGGVTANFMAIGT
jgi:hypothetical protein